MDTSAFEAEVDDDMSLIELYSTLPEEVKGLVEVLLFFARCFAKLGFAIAALACCAWASAILIAWICLFWLQTQLLWRLAALLRLCFEVPKITYVDDKSPDNSTTRSDGGSEKPHLSSDGLHGGANSRASRALSASHTTEQFDLFEAFLNSPKVSDEHSTPVPSSQASAVEIWSAQRDEPSNVHISSREINTVIIGDRQDHLNSIEATGKVLTYPSDLDERAGRNTESAGRIGDDFDKQKETVPRETGEESDQSLSDGDFDPPVAKPTKSTGLTKHSFARRMQEAITLAKKEAEVQKRAAQQTAWLERLKSGGQDYATRKGFRLGNHHVSSKTGLSPNAAGATTRGSNTLSANTLNSRFTSEQLAEAANFAAEATRGGSKRNHGRIRNRSLQPQSRNTHLRNTNQAATAALQQHRSAQNHYEQTSSSSPATLCKENPQDVVKSGHATASKTEPGKALPPHLRKKPAAQELPSANQTATVQHPGSKYTRTPIPTAPRTDVNDSGKLNQPSEDESQVLPPFEAPHAHATQSEDYTNDHSLLKGNQTFNVDSCDDNLSDSLLASDDCLPDLPQKSRLQQLSSDNSIETERHACTTALTPAGESQSKHKLVCDENIETNPPIMKPAQRPMSIEGLKALNTGPEQVMNYRIAQACKTVSNWTVGQPAGYGTTPVPSVVVVPNTPTDDEAKPSGRVPCENAINSLESDKIDGSRPGPKECNTTRGRDISPSEPDATSMQNEQQAQTEGVQGALQQRRSGPCRSPERRAALQQAVHALNEQTHKKRASLDALRECFVPNPGLPQSVDENDKINQKGLVSRSSYQHPELLDLIFETAQRQPESGSSVPTSKPSFPLSAKAPAFFAPLHRAVEDDRIPKGQRKLESSIRGIQPFDDALSKSIDVAGNTDPAHSFGNFEYHPVTTTNVLRSKHPAPPRLTRGNGVGQQAFDALLDKATNSAAKDAHGQPTRPAWNRHNLEQMLEALLAGIDSQLGGRSKPIEAATFGLRAFAKPFKLHSPGKAVDTYSADKGSKGSEAQHEHGGHDSGACQMSLPPVSVGRNVNVGGSLDQRFQFVSSPQSALWVPGETGPDSTNTPESKPGEVRCEAIEQGNGPSVDQDHDILDHEKNETVVPISQQESTLTTKKRRQKARAALRDAWREREEIRRRLVSTWTLGGLRSLEYASTTYNDKRKALALTMANHKLSEGDAKVFPSFAKSDLSAPKLTPPGLSEDAGSSKATYEGAVVEESSKDDEENNEPVIMMERAEIEKLEQAAIEARKSYEEAHNYFSRPQPEGRSNRKDLRAKGEARIELAAKRYRKKVDALEAAFPDGLPARLARELWSYDDDAIKRSRDEWTR